MDYSKGQNIALYDFSKKQTRLVTDVDGLLDDLFRRLVTGRTPRGVCAKQLHKGKAVRAPGDDARRAIERGVSHRYLCRRPPSLWAGHPTARHGRRRRSSRQNLGGRHAARHRRPVHASAIVGLVLVRGFPRFHRMAGLSRTSRAKRDSEMSTLSVSTDVMRTASPMILPTTWRHLVARQPLSRLQEQSPWLGRPVDRRGQGRQTGRATCEAEGRHAGGAFDRLDRAGDFLR